MEYETFSGWKTYEKYEPEESLKNKVILRDIKLVKNNDTIRDIKLVENI